MAGPYDDVLQEMGGGEVPRQSDVAPEKIPAAQPGSGPYDDVLNLMKADQLLDNNPGFKGKLKEFFAMTGQGTLRGLAMDAGMPVDNINALGRFITSSPGAATEIARNAPVLAGMPMAAAAIKQAVHPGDIETGSTKQIRQLMKDAGIPTESAEEAGLTSGSAHWGSEIGEFMGANVPFLFLNPTGGGARYIPEVVKGLNPQQIAAAASKIGANPASWKAAAGELAPVGHLLTETVFGGLGPASGAALGKAVVGKEYEEAGKDIGAMGGNLRLGLMKAAYKGTKSGWSWFHDLLGFGTGAKTTAGKSLALMTGDLPTAIDTIARGEPANLAPGMYEPITMPDGRVIPSKIPVDLATGDRPLIAFRQHLTDLDRQLAGDYDKMWEQGHLAGHEHAEIFPEARLDQHAENVQATLQNRQWAIDQLMEKRVLQATELAQQDAETAFAGVERTPENINLVKSQQAAVLKRELGAAEQDSALVVDGLWEPVDKARPRDMEPVYDSLNTMRAEMAASAQDRKHFPNESFGKFFDHEGEPVFGPGTTLKQVIELDSSVQAEIRSKRRDPNASDIYLSYLKRLSNSLNKVKAEAAPGEDSEILRRALDATKAHHNTFDRGPVGRVLGYGRDSGAAVPDADTMRQFLVSDAKGVQSFDALLGALGRRTGGKVPLEGDAMQDILAPYLRQEFFDQVTRKGGAFSVADAQQWMKNHAGPMRAFPKMRDEFTRAIATRGEEIGAQAQSADFAKQRESKDINKNAANLYLNGRPSAWFDAARKSADPRKAMSELIAATDFDTTGAASKGLAQMTISHMLWDSRVPLETGGPVQWRVSGRKAREWLVENRGMVSALAERFPGIGERFDTITNTFEFLERYHAAPRIPKAEDKLGGGMIRDIAARLMGANILAKFGAGEGASFQTAAIGSNVMKTIAQALTPEQSIKLIRQALVDKQLYMDLTRNWNKASPTQQQAAVYRLAPYLYSIGVPLSQPYLNPQGTTPQEKKSPVRSGEVPDLGVSQDMLDKRVLGDPSGIDSDKSRWPTDDDVASAIRYDLPYGDRSAGFFNPGASKIRTLPIDEAPAAVNQGKLDTAGKLETTTPQMADSMMRQWLAARKSAVASVGFDPRHIVSSPTNKANPLTAGGVYSRKSDMAWYSRDDESSAVHEMIHRGLQKLIEAGVVPKSSQRESVVRGLMLRHFGDIEMGGGKENDKQVDWARNYGDTHELDRIEEAAAKYRAQQQPRGPH